MFFGQIQYGALDFPHGLRGSLPAYPYVHVIGYMPAYICSRPRYSDSVPDTVTMSMVESMQMVASDLAFWRMRWNMEPMAMKLRGL
jgi:hypothetical protein